MSIHRGQWHKHPAIRTADRLTIGERAAEAMRNAMGSGVFVGCFFAVMILWAVANPVFYVGGRHGKHGFDPYPYILVNLFLLMLAGVRAAALLITSKRQDAINSALALHEHNLLTENTRITKEVHVGVEHALTNTQLLHRLCEKFGVEHDDILKEVTGHCAGDGAWVTSKRRTGPMRTDALASFKEAAPQSRAGVSQARSACRAAVRATVGAPERRRGGR